LQLKKETFDDLLLALLPKVIQQGERVKATRGSTRELYGVRLEIENPLSRLSLTESRGKIFSALGELFWYLSGSSSLEFIKYYISAYSQDSEDGATIHGAYGPRIFDAGGVDQLSNVMALLTEKPRSRRAVIQIFDAADIARQRKEIPCTTSLQFVMPQNRLTLIVNMRSNDAYMGLPHDVFAFTMIQELVARTLGVEMGSYIHFAGSMHIYENKIPDAEAYIREGYQDFNLNMPAMPVGDPWNSIEILKDVELQARSGAPPPDLIKSMDPYWQDLARMFEVFAASKSHNEFRLRDLSDEMHHEIYSQYIDARIEAASKRTGHQGLLDLDGRNRI